MAEQNRTVATPDRLAGVVLEVKNLAATRAFYEMVFRNASGTWNESDASLAFVTASQRVEFVCRARPRVSGDSAMHMAFRVGGPGSRLATALAEKGHRVEWWREDHAAERQPAPYVEDPSGNRVQLVAGDADGVLIDHVGVEFADLDYAEAFYVKALGATVESYHGWSSGRNADLKGWIEGDDPCAPWTRISRFSFRSRTMEGHMAPQLFLGFGGSRLALFLALQHRQESPEEIVKGTPRVILRSGRPADDVVADLAGPARAAVAEQFSGRTVAFSHEADSIFLRDPGGNYVELECA